jgi:hypothetical protein
MNFSVRANQSEVNYNHLCCLLGIEHENGIAWESTVITGRRIIAGRSLRWNEDRARAAYAQGLWVHETLTDALQRAVVDEPDRILIIDGQVRIDARSLHAQALTLAQLLAARFPAG